LLTFQLWQTVTRLRERQPAEGSISQPPTIIPIKIACKPGVSVNRAFVQATPAAAKGVRGKGASHPPAEGADPRRPSRPARCDWVSRAPGQRRSLCWSRGRERRPGRDPCQVWLKHRAAVETTITATGAKSEGLYNSHVYCFKTKSTGCELSQRADPNNSPFAKEQVPKVMKYTPREFQTGDANQSAPLVGGATTLSSLPGAISANVIDFSDARERLSAGFKESRQEFETSRKSGRRATRQILPAWQGDRLEESLYWLLSATTVACLILAIIGL
jgi:hypothetical protein